MMKKVLYVSNIEVPYRAEFFNQLAKKVDLTVLYERQKSANRDEKWTKSVKPNYKIKYLKGIKYKNEYEISLSILKYVFSKNYDKVIIGCYNSPSQMLAILFMKLFHKKYILNLDGECFLEGNGFKEKIKRFFIKGADKYLVAGEKSGESLSRYVSREKIFPYYFSSLTKKELMQNRKHKNRNSNNCILVIGQYFDYKGLDVALEVAAMNQKIKYKFIGAGIRSNLLKSRIKEINLINVEVIDFLSKDDLYKEYQNCSIILLPSKQECWGLVVNEAASFGCPIVSTYGSGAAVEFLATSFNNFLTKPNNPKEIYDIIEKSWNKNLEEYKNFLLQKSREYYIEKNVEITYKIINEED